MSSERSSLPNTDWVLTYIFWYKLYTYFKLWIMANIKDKTITKLSDLKQYQATVELTREPHHFNVHQAMENTV